MGRGALFCMLLFGAPWATSRGEVQPPSPSSPEHAVTATSFTVQTASDVLRDPRSDEASQRMAVDFLISRGESSEAMTHLREALGPDRSVTTRIIVAEQIARHPPLPPRALTPLLAANLDPAQPTLAAASLRALARYQSREAVRAILDGLLASEPPAPSSLIPVAIETLIAQTGLTAFGEDLEAWRDWWSRAQWFTEQEWRTQISRQQATTASALRRQKVAAVALAADLYRRLHAASPDEMRSDLLAEMMASSEMDIRRMGVDLTMRALLNGKLIDDKVATAVAARLDDPSALIRAEAATILDRLNRPFFSAVLTQALRIERNADAAAAMLRAVENEPTDAAITAALRWIPSGPPASDAAIGVLRSAHASGLLRSEELVAHVRAELELLYPDRLSQQAMSLMIALGGGQAVIDLLDAEASDRSAMAANALVDWPLAVDALIAATPSKPALRDAAVRSLMRHRLTAEGFSAARRLLNEREPSHWEALLQYARALPADELLLVAKNEPILESREALIAHTVTPDFLALIAEPTARIDLLVLAIQTRLALGRAADALAVLDGTPTELLGPRLRALRVTSLLCLDRVPDAVDYTRQSAEIGADSAMLRAWLDGLDYSIQKPFASRIRDTLVEQFPDVAISSEAYRFGSLTNRMPIPPAQSPPSVPPAGEGRERQSSAPATPES